MVSIGTRRVARENGRWGRSRLRVRGLIDDVHIYSFALTKADIAADMRGRVDGSAVQRAADPGYQEVPCRILSDHEDARIPAASAIVGVLVAVACIGLWPSTGALLCLTVSFAAGLVLTSHVLQFSVTWLVDDAAAQSCWRCILGWLGETSEQTQRLSRTERCEKCSGRGGLVTQYFFDHIFLYRCGQNLPHKFSDP